MRKFEKVEKVSESLRKIEKVFVNGKKMAEKKFEKNLKKILPRGGAKKERKQELLAADSKTVVKD